MFGQLPPPRWCGGGVVCVPASGGVVVGELESLLEDGGVCADDGPAEVIAPARKPSPSAPATPIAASVRREIDGFSKYRSVMA